MRKLKNNLKSLLAEKGETLKTLSESTGLDVNSLSRIANYKANSIKFEYIEKICSFLDCELTDIFDLEKKRVNDFKDLKIA